MTILGTNPAQPDLLLWADGVADGVILGVQPRSLPAGVQATVQLRLPEGVDLVSSWAGAPESNPGRLNNGVVEWTGVVGPYFCRIRLDEYTTLSTAAEARWDGGNLESGALPLAGLVRETGLRKTLLPNGLTVLTKERPDSTTVAVTVAVRAGSRDEDDVTSGGSHWLEHAHFLGTSRRPDNQAVFGAVEAVGGDMNATTGWEITDYFVSAPADQFDLVLDVLSDMLLESVFPEEAFERERKVVFEELNRRQNTPGALAGDLFYSTLLQHHPAHRLIGGTIDSVRNIPLATILDYRRQRYVAGNMVISAVGRIQHAAATAKIEAAFSAVPPGDWIDRAIATEPPLSERREARVELGDKQVQLLLGGLAPSASSPDREAFLIIDAILDHPGRRLAAEIRDKRGLANSAGASYFSLTDVGAWSVGAVTQPEHLDEVIALLLEQLRRIRDEPVQQQEIADAVRSVRGSRQIGEERNMGQARRLARDSALGLLEPVDAWLDRLETITPADVQRVAQAYLDLEHYTLVVVTF